MPEHVSEVLVVGAGVAGLSCARELHRAGIAVTVLDKGRSIGGRCSTWRADGGHTLDYGVTFFHGSAREFLAELDQLDGLIEGWPRRTVGRGDPCQPRALAAHERRVGLRPGVSALPKHLAGGLDVRTRTQVDRLTDTDNGIAAEAGDERWRARTLVLALPCEQARDLLEPLSGADTEVAGTRRLLGMLGTVPCLTVMATFEQEPPDWHLMLPADSRAVQLVTNESSKRPDTKGSALVIQARPAWSAEHLRDAPDAWTAALLREAAAEAGDWITAPLWSRAHRWRFARTDLATELAEPILIAHGGARIGVAGELFSRGAGVEAAYLAGRALGRRILGGDHD